MIVHTSVPLQRVVQHGSHFVSDFHLPVRVSLSAGNKRLFLVKAHSLASRLFEGDRLSVVTFCAHPQGSLIGPTWVGVCATAHWFGEYIPLAKSQLLACRKFRRLGLLKRGPGGWESVRCMAAPQCVSPCTMRIMAWNVNSITSTKANVHYHAAYGSLSKFFSHFGDVICLQEVKLPMEKQTKDIACIEGWESFWAISRSKKGYSGVTSWTSSSFSPVAAEVDTLGGGEDDIDLEGRVVITDLQHFVLINVYVPNAGYPDRQRIEFKCRFLHALKARADAYTAAGRKVVMVGDFNVAMSRKDVHPRFKFDEMYTEEELSIMRELLLEYSDVWRELHPDVDNQYTVWDEKTDARSRNQGVRIDYVLVSKNMRQQVVSCEIIGTDAIPPKWSDHAAMVVELRDAEPVPAHAPCALSSLKDRRWNDPSQKKLSAMFAAAPRKPEAGVVSADLKLPSGSKADLASLGGPCSTLDASDADRPAKLMRLDSCKHRSAVSTPSKVRRDLTEQPSSSGKRQRGSDDAKNAMCQGGTAKGSCELGDSAQIGVAKKEPLPKARASGQAAAGKGADPKQRSIASFFGKGTNA